MLKFDLKNKLKLDNKTNDNEEKDTVDDSENNLKNEMIASILGKEEDGSEEEQPVTFADLGSLDESQGKNQEKTQKQIQQLKEKVQKTTPPKVEQILQPKIEKPQTSNISKSVSPETVKITQLIKAIENSTEKMIVPFIDMNQGKITYPILTKIQESGDNIELLNKLASPSFEVLEKTIYERFAVCPQHPDSLSVNIRLYCPKCNAMDISKLHLIEHRRCGYISENVNFETASDGSITKCPSCKKEIRNQQKEITMPAMWYTCNSCNEKFDDVLIKLHCRKGNHDFDTNHSHAIVVPGYRLKNLADTSNSSISPILNQLKSLLNKYGFSAEENYTVTGKSGNHHSVNIYGQDEHDRTVFIFIKNPNAESDNSELNSKIIQVLDTTPSVAILIGFPSISEKAKAITSNYNISIVTKQDPETILSSINTILDEKVPKLQS